ncbi:MAG TPA: enoyl-CoA hydratase-related protein [Syntrophales bacterium]|nr:enoyl-CoA hydratase-related protein [Syntrophales bacterium]
MDFQNILFERKDGVATIRLNRPKFFNAIDFGLGNDLARALEICHDDDETRVVALTGEGKAFCSGGDLKVFRENMQPHPQDIVRQLIKVFNIIIMGLRQMPKPVVAVVNGPVGGGGFSLAAACDIRIAARSAIFRQAYTSISLVPDGAWTLVVPMLIGFGKATELVLLDPILSAEDAQQWGLVNRVVDDADLWKVSEGIIGKLAKGPTRAFAIAKENLNNAMLGLLYRQLELERSGMIQAARSADYREGLTAFFDKRTAVFNGR